MGNEVRVTEIRWTSTPIDRIELVDPLLLTDTELYEYIRELQRDNFTLREMLSVSLGHTVKLTEQNQQLTRQNKAARERRAA